MHLPVKYNNYNTNIKFCQLVITYVLLLCHSFSSFLSLTPSDGGGNWAISRWSNFQSYTAIQELLNDLLIIM